MFRKSSFDKKWKYYCWFPFSSIDSFSSIPSYELGSERFFLRFKKNLEDWLDTHKDHICFLLYQHLPSFCILFYVCVYVTANVIKLVIIHISQLLCIMSSPIGKSDEKRNLHQIFRLFCIIFMLNGEFEYQIDLLSQ